MNRKIVTPEIQAYILLKARRRCCICFGLNRDTSIKQGQIAHLDGDPSNNAETNLAFLCFDHHDQYDSTTRQSKNFTKIEVLQFKEELIKSINMAFSGPVFFGEATDLGADSITGHYIRDGKYESAEIKVKRLPDDKYHIEGIALWGTDREHGPNIGDLNFVAELHDNQINFTWRAPGREPYKVLLKFKNGKLIITEKNWVGIFGMNVAFQGEYQKAT
ncbi:MAG: hypothetical protein A2Y79_03565 [Deltaproteobacteria bacterium RBG_13_43_22]|nr:MAG: hypothetical protein A2Y79_03565 [Deltaproteobacteria bacterium RBG_13_43_22]